MAHKETQTRLRIQYLPAQWQSLLGSESTDCSQQESLPCASRYLSQIANAYAYRAAFKLYHDHSIELAGTNFLHCSPISVVDYLLSDLHFVCHLRSPSMFKGSHKPETLSSKKFNLTQNSFLEILLAWQP